MPDGLHSRQECPCARWCHILTGLRGLQVNGVPGMLTGRSAPHLLTTPSLLPLAALSPPLFLCLCFSFWFPMSSFSSQLSTCFSALSVSDSSDLMHLLYLQLLFPSCSTHLFSLPFSVLFHFPPSSPLLGKSSFTEHQGLPLLHPSCPPWAASCNLRWDTPCHHIRLPWPALLMISGGWTYAVPAGWPSWSILR